MPPRRLAALLLVCCGGLTACASDPATVSPSGVDMLEIPTPDPRPGDFVRTVDNPWLPLLPGAEWVYRTERDGTRTVTVTDDQREVSGVTTTVVRTVETGPDGGVLGREEEWFAQDRDGNVWLFGRDARGGSWEAGVDAAEAGLAMAARPRRGDGYAEEEAPGVAEDRATVLSLDESLNLTADSWTGLVEIERTTPLETGLVEHTFYARGTGPVLEETVSGGSRRAELVEFTPGESAR